jgi:hypothetical protein
VQDDQAHLFRCGGDEQIRDLSTALMLFREKTLDLTSTPHVLCTGFNKSEHVERLAQVIPFPGTTG